MLRRYYQTCRQTLPSRCFSSFRGNNLMDDDDDIPVDVGSSKSKGGKKGKGSSNGGSNDFLNMLELGSNNYRVEPIAVKKDVDFFLGRMDNNASKNIEKESVRETTNSFRKNTPPPSPQSFSLDHILNDSASWEAESFSLGDSRGHGRESLFDETKQKQYSYDNRTRDTNIGGGFRDRNSNNGSGGFRDRNNSFGNSNNGGFKDRNSSYGGSSQSGGGFKDRNSSFAENSNGGGVRDRNSGFKDRNSSYGSNNGGGFRDRNVSNSDFARNDFQSRPRSYSNEDSRFHNFDSRKSPEYDRKSYVPPTPLTANSVDADGRKLTSPWSEMKGTTEVQSPGMPVPITGEILYGLHPILAALDNPKRDFKAMYVLTSAYTKAMELLQMRATLRTESTTPLAMEDTPMNTLDADNTDFALDALLADPTLGTSFKPSLISTEHTESLALTPMARAIQKAEERKIKIFKLTREKLDVLSENRPHNGIVVDLLPIQSSKETPVLMSNHIWVAMDGLYDPQNLGAIARSGGFFGIKGLILPDDGASITSTVAKIASGALERLDLHKVASLPNSINKIKSQSNALVVGMASGADAVSIDTVVPDVNQPVLIIMGNEREGLSPSVRAVCDVIARIDGPGQDKMLDSLNVSIAASIAMHQISKNRSQQ